jgi:hypothetical protein
MAPTKNEKVRFVDNGNKNRLRRLSFQPRQNEERNDRYKCHTFTGTTNVPWLPKKGRLVQISIRNNGHKIKMAFRVTSGEILREREINAYIMSVDKSCWKDL